MIPFLVCLLLFSKVKFITAPFVFIASALFLWNVMYGLVPLNIFDLSNHEIIRSKLEQKPDAYFVLKNDQRAISRLYYSTGNELYPHIIPAPDSGNYSAIHLKIDRLLSSGKIIYTDCIDYPGILSRQGIKERIETVHLFTGYNYHPVDSVNSIFGKYYLHRIYCK